ncbi:MAG: Metal dependent phosphohydrolase [Thermotoga sp. 50_1627]|nr:MAG: Metal dependent phosphohydrolase [Thermotoga sp. 50_1627]
MLLLVCSLHFALSLRVGIYDNPPQVYLSDGRPAGLYIEVLESIAEDNGWKIEYVFATFSEQLENLKTGRIDILVSIAYTEERAKLYDYNNEALLLNWGVICVQKNFQYRDITDLAGKTVAVSKGDVYGQAFLRELERYLVSVNLLELPDYPDVLRAVQEKRAAAGVVSRIYAVQNHQKFDAKITGTIFSPVELRFAFPKGSAINATLIDKIDEYLRKLKSDHEAYNNLIARYLGMEKRVVPPWLATLLLVTGVGLVVFASWTLSLRVLVKLKTRELLKKNEELEQLNEEILAQQQELSTLNEQLEHTYERLESSLKRFSDILSFLSGISPDVAREDFYKMFLSAAQGFDPNAIVVLMCDGECYLLDRGSMKKITVKELTSCNDRSKVVDLVSETLGIDFEAAVYEVSKDGETALLFLYKDHSVKHVDEDLAEALCSVLTIYIKLKKHEEALTSLSEGVTHAFLRALEFHEQHTAKHSETVKNYAVKMVRKLGLGERQAQLIGCAALLHDLGKLAVPSTVLNKPARLSAEELQLVKQHPVIAAEIIRHIRGLEEVAKIVRHHHERWDGKGYPDGLSGEEIPLGARILCIADAFEAMTSVRPYRNAMSISEAVSELISNAGKQFDPNLVRIFLEILKEEGVSVVES